jgi:hypothetical protein
MKINVGLLVSYDYQFLKQSLPLIYKDSDRIVLALDENYNTWSGNKFEIDDEFFTWIKKFDTENKIEFYRDDFYDPNLTAIQNETRERTMLSNYFGAGTWYIQIDSDENFVNFSSFVAALRSKSNYLVNPEKNKVQICLFFVNLFKKVDGGYLYVANPLEPFTCATNYIDYKTARVTYARKVYLPFFVVHNTWAREESEIYFKLKNWGHNNDFDVDKYFNFWKNVTKSNYKDFTNVHPVEGKKWKKLEFCPGNNLTEVIDYFKTTKRITISPLYIFGKNSAQKIKHL